MVRRLAARTASGPGRGPARDLDHLQFIAIQAQRGERATPDRAGVDRVHAVADEQAQRRPVATGELEPALHAPRHRVPGIEPRRLRARSTLFLERDAAARAAVTHAGENVDDRALAVGAAQARRPGPAGAAQIAQ